MATSTTFLPATVTIRDLPLGTTLSGTELFEAVQTTAGVANSVQITGSQIATLAGTSQLLAGSGISVATTATTTTVTWAPGTSVVSGNALSVSTTATTVTIAWAPGTTIVAGSGISVGTSATAATITWAPGTSVVAGSRIAVTTTATTVSVALASVAGLSVMANAAVGSAVPAPIVGAANQLVVVNNAATTVLFQGLATTLDLGIGSTQGAVLYRNAASWVILAPGTSGQFLQTQGAGANPQWAGGAMVLLNTLTPNNVATAGDTTSLTSAYHSYLITFENVCPATQTTFLQMQVATTGTSFVSGGYVSLSWTDIAATVGGIQDQSTTVILLSGMRATTALQTTTAYGLNGFVRLFNPASTAFRKSVVGEVTYLSPGASGTSTIALSHLAGYWDGGNNAITGIEFLFNSGNIQTGTIKLYGLT